MIYRFILLGVLLLTNPSWAQDTTVEYTPGADGKIPIPSGHELVLDARLVEGGDAIERGMVWRVFETRKDDTGKLPLVATAMGGTASFTLDSGSYLVHAAFGRAGASKQITINGAKTTESFVLRAGGLELYANTNNQPIPAKALRFSIFELDQDEEGNRKMIAFNVAANKVIQLNEGTYHVLSRYGTINATVRADLEVKAGQVTKAVLQHRGAPVSLRLVSQKGGDPVANTAWSVLTEDGENVFSSRLISPSLILAEGTYEAVVRYGKDTFRQTFIIKPGLSNRVEILLK